MQLSVIIPTYNRAPILKSCLEHLITQKDLDFEVVLVDDGSTDETEAVVRSFIERGELKINYLKQKNALQAAARNRGAKEAKADLILFIDDDIFVKPGMLKAHLKAHQKHPQEEVVVLGFSTWDPALQLTEYMKFLERSGWQFRYSVLKPGFLRVNQPYKFFYTSNLSLKKSFLQQEKFDEQFKVYGSEDIELGYRLWKRQGMKMFYEPKAQAHHHNQLTQASILKRMQSVGRSVVYFQQKHPDAQAIPKGPRAWMVKLAILPIIYPLALALGRWLSQDLYFQLMSRKAFWEGVKKEWRTMHSKQKSEKSV